MSTLTTRDLDELYPDRTRRCISGCCWGTDDAFHHHPFCHLMDGKGLEKTLFVNLFGGPGTGKSTNAALTFGMLKNRGINTELITEYAKKLTWERRSHALRFQPYVTSKQAMEQHRLRDQVEVAITDSPLLLGAVYEGDGCTPSWSRYVLELFNTFNNLNIFLCRNTEAHPYSPRGRNQTEEQAIEIDGRIQEMLEANGVPFYTVQVHPGDETARIITDCVLAVRETW